MATPASQVKYPKNTPAKPAKPEAPKAAPAASATEEPKEKPRTPEEKRKAFSVRANLQIRTLTAVTERIEKMMRSKAYEATPGQHEALLTAVRTLTARILRAVEGEKKEEAPAIPEA